MAYVKTGLLDPFKDHTDMKFPRSAGFMGYFGSLIMNIQTNWKTLKFSKHFFPLSTGIHMHQRVFFSNILIKTKEITFICLFMIYFINRIDRKFTDRVILLKIWPLDTSGEVGYDYFITYIIDSVQVCI